MQDSKLSVYQNPEAELDEATRFDKSLQELRNLRSQLHYAADYCEATFLNAKQKKIVVENTKEYICRAMVTVVDHLGNVSANLDHGLSKNDVATQTELRMDCLKQRLTTCQQYGHKLAITKLCWRSDVPRYHPRYISPPIPGQNEVSRKYNSPIAAKTIKRHGFESHEEVPLFLCTYNHKSSLAKGLTAKIGANEKEPSSSSVLPVRDGLCLNPKSQIPFQFEGTHKHKRHLLNWKTVQNSDILSLIRRSKRTT
ncbi:probable protein ABIL5 [Cornus florida]|uniref:probable protein ABIL5 n=1 Tax=Cornus florida TaxID=4283 RepID=UPI002896D0E7|nr:probable protein ABIL5 [Cornus florida]